MSKIYKLKATEEGQLLADLMRAADIDFKMPCAGNHTCGKCRVKVSGDLGEVTPSEMALLGQKAYDEGYRLACFAKVNGEVTVDMPEDGESKILLSEDNRMRVNEPMMPEGKYGVAIDIGTTTVVVTLYDAKGTHLATRGLFNRQSKFGADVISRIDYGIHHNNEIVHETIVTQLEEMIDGVAEDAGIVRADITHAVATGNTTMMHFLAGLDPKGIGFKPFTPQSLFDTEHDDILKGMTVYIPPCVSSYVGADTVCCIVSSRMLDTNHTTLIVDIGTNGEMALWHEGKLFACSTAAGPAFEGAGISMGMLAAAGAISHVYWEDDQMKYNTIGDAKPIGVCGSGILDAIAILVRQDSVELNGRLKMEGHSLAAQVREEKERYFVFPKSNVTFNQTDIRQIQLAKAAIYAGINTMCQACGIKPTELEVLYLCGGFGSFLNLDSAETIGLLPKDSKEHTVALGNGAIRGAAEALLCKDIREEMRNVVKGCHYIELSESPAFMDNYVEAMMLGTED